MDEYFHGGKTMEPTVQLLSNTQKSRLSKVASEASEWSSSVRSTPGKTYILVLAMGASEFYGPNRNGDAFREVELKKKYKTFETNAHVFRSHVNKDPAKSMGSVVKAFYNDEMHRVELILELEDSKCPDIVDKIRNNETVAVSMGCRIEFDVCTICGNKAPSRKEYCDHLLNELNDIYPDGRIVAADNPDPNFFDISVVYKPADKTGYMLKKVANHGSRELGEPSSVLAEKAASKTAISEYLSKAADIEKIVTGIGFGTSSAKSTAEVGNPTNNSYLVSKWIQTIVPKLTANSSKIDNQDLQYLSTKNMPKVLSTLSDMGIFLMTPEFLDLVFNKITGSNAPEGLATKLISLQGDIFRLLSRHPDIVGDVLSSGTIIPSDSSSSSDKEVKTKMSKYLGTRSMLDNFLKKSSYESKVQQRSSEYIKRPSLLNTAPGVTLLAVKLAAAYRVYTIDKSCAGDSLISGVSPELTKVAGINTPWVPYTISALDNNVAGVYNTKTSSYTVAPSGRGYSLSKDATEVAIINLIYR